MLAKTYDSEKQLPLYMARNEGFIVQPKLDGVRCLVQFSERGEVIAYSRNQKPLVIGDTLVKALEALHRAAYPKLKPGVFLDGELYIHGLSFQEIQGKVSKQDPSSEDKLELQYHIYDYHDPSTKMDFEDRYDILSDIHFGNKTPAIKFVATMYSCKKDIEYYMETFVGGGYEGMIIRDPDAVYAEGHRSPGLLKYKRWYDEEFKVIDIEEGRGKNKNTAILVCTIGRCSRTFKVTAPGKYAEKAHVWSNPHLFIDKPVTVKYQEKTKKGIPRFPIALGFKEDR